MLSEKGNQGLFQSISAICSTATSTPLRLVLQSLSSPSQLTEFTPNPRAVSSKLSLAALAHSLRPTRSLTANGRPLSARLQRVNSPERSLKKSLKKFFEREVRREGNVKVVVCTDGRRGRGNS